MLLLLIHNVFPFFNTIKHFWSWDNIRREKYISNVGWKNKIKPYMQISSMGVGYTAVRHKRAVGFLWGLVRKQSFYSSRKKQVVLNMIFCILFNLGKITKHDDIEFSLALCRKRACFRTLILISWNRLCLPCIYILVYLKTDALWQIHEKPKVHWKHQDRLFTYYWSQTIFNGCFCPVFLAVNFMTLNALISFYIIRCLWVGRMAQWLWALGAVTEDLCLISSTHMVVHNHL